MAKNEAGLGRRIQYVAEYAAVRLLSAAAGVLPERLAVLGGRALGRLLWLIAVRRRRIARRNIERAMPGERTRREINRLVREVFLHIGLTAVETLWMRRHGTKDRIAARFPMDGIEAVRKAREGGRGVILFTMHQGNWELYGATVAAQMDGVNALARPVNNPLVRRYTTELRESLGMKVLSTREGVRPMLRALRRGEAVAVLIDQHVNRAYVPVTFFGRPAATTAVVASLALRLDAPVFVGYGMRDGYGFRHHGRLQGPLELVRTGDRDADIAANTQRFNDTLEEIIRRTPGQWLWTHRRWKLAGRVERGREEENAGDVGQTD